MSTNYLNCKQNRNKLWLIRTPIFSSYQPLARTAFTPKVVHVIRNLATREIRMICRCVLACHVPDCTIYPSHCMICLRVLAWNVPGFTIYPPDCMFCLCVLISGVRLHDRSIRLHDLSTCSSIEFVNDPGR